MRHPNATIITGDVVYTKDEGKNVIEHTVTGFCNNGVKIYKCKRNKETGEVVEDLGFKLEPLTSFER